MKPGTKHYEKATAPDIFLTSPFKEGQDVDTPDGPGQVTDPGPYRTKVRTKSGENSFLTTDVKSL